MALETTVRTNAGEQGFVEDVLEHAHRSDIALISAIPVLLVAVSRLPSATLEQFAFDTTQPTLLTAFASHFVHMDALHLAGNLSVYCFVVGIPYVLCILSNRRRFFLLSFLTLVLAFPIVLSSMQLLFPREQLILGFSGINAGFAGMACFVFTGYLRTNITPRAEERYAPVFFFLTTGLIALITLPAVAFRFEIAAASFALAVVYVAVALRRQGMPTRADVRRAANRPGYFETAGAALGLIVGYPFVAFQDVVILQNGVLNVYIHLLGSSLAFTLLFTYVFVATAYNRTYGK